jgi:predicted RNA-binding protein YlqC (UPF0109 family)
MENHSSLTDLIKGIAEYLVDKPDAVIVKETSGDQTTVIELRVAKEDVGKVIGKSGRTASALRTILLAAGVTVGKRAVLEILE